MFQINGQQYSTHDCKKILILKTRVRALLFLRRHPYFQFTDSASAFIVHSLTEIFKQIQKTISILY
jgi:hypothetical protein